MYSIGQNVTRLHQLKYYIVIVQDDTSCSNHINNNMKLRFPFEHQELILN